MRTNFNSKLKLVLISETHLNIHHDLLHAVASGKGRLKIMKVKLCLVLIEIFHLYPRCTVAEHTVYKEASIEALSTTSPPLLGSDFGLSLCTSIPCALLSQYTHYIWEARSFEIYFSLAESSNICRAKFPVSGLFLPSARAVRSIAGHFFSFYFMDNLNLITTSFSKP